MQQRDRIQRELQIMQEECVTEYLQQKLQQITSKQVIRDILQEFLQTNNQQFMQNISENIIQAKQQNRQLKKQLQSTIIQNQSKIEQVSKFIQQQCHKKFSQEIILIRQSYNRDILEFQNQNKLIVDQNKNLNYQIQTLKLKIKQIQTSIIQYQQVNKQLADTKRSFSNFKQQCQKIINQCNRQKERQKQKLIEELKQAQEIINQNMILNFNQKEIQQKLLACEQREKLLRDQLKNSQQKLLELNKQKQNLSIKLQESKVNQNFNLQSYVELTRINESNQMSINYLKEQNNFLRQQILSFSSRYLNLEVQKDEIMKSKLQIQKKLTEQRNQYQIAQQKLKIDYNNIITIQKNAIIQLEKQIFTLKIQLENFGQKVEEKNSELILLREQCNKYQKSMQQLKLTCLNIEVKQGQLKRYEQYISKIQENHRQELRKVKESFDTTWNTKNQELIQEKYVSHQLKLDISRIELENIKSKEQIISLKTLIRQKQEYCQILKREINTFKNIFSTKKTAKDTQNFKNKQQKFYFLLCQVIDEVQLLKHSNQQLRNIILHGFAQINNYFQQSVASFLARRGPEIKFVQLPIKSEPNQQLNIKKHIQLKLIKNSKEDSLSRTVQQRGQQSSNFTQIKKTLKNIHQRYQTMQSQNKSYATHIDSIIKKA